MENLGRSGSGGTGKATRTDCKSQQRLRMLDPGRLHPTLAAHACPICLGGASRLHDEALNRLAMQRLMAELGMTLADKP